MLATGVCPGRCCVWWGCKGVAGLQLADCGLGQQLQGEVKLPHCDLQDVGGPGWFVNVCVCVFVNVCVCPCHM